MRAHGTLQIQVFNDEAFAENGYLAWVRASREAWIIDPGFPPQPAAMLETLSRNGLTPVAIVLTHAHVDHIAGVASLREALPGVPLLVPRDEASLLDDPYENLSAQIGMRVVAPPADRRISPGDELALGPLTWRAIDVAGHSPGGLAYHCSELAVAFVGDAVFAEGIGRTDFPHSDHDRLIRNLRDNLLTLPPQTTLYPGHGPPTCVRDCAERNATLRAELARR